MCCLEMRLAHNLVCALSRANLPSVEDLQVDLPAAVEGVIRIVSLDAN